MSEAKNRLHPAAIPIGIAENGTRLGGFMAALLLGGRGEGFRWVLFGVGFLAITSVLNPVLRYLRTRYYFEGEALVIEGGGFFSRFRRVMPLDRIQSVDVVRKLRHRAFGVVELRIEVIGGGGHEAEANLTALKPNDAEALRSAVLRGGHGAEVHAAAGPIIQLGPRELLLAGATGGRVAVIAVMLSYLAQPIPGDRIFQRLFGEGQGVLTRVIVSLGAFIVISVLISLVVTVFVYWQFAVTVQGDRLLITRGLLETRQAYIPFGRIQAVRINENLLRRILKLASVSIVIAGYSGKGQEKTETSMLLPIASRGEARRLAAVALGTSEIQTADLQRAPSGSFMRRALYVLLPLTVPTGVAVWQLGPIGWAVLALSIPGWAWVFVAYRGLGSQLTPSTVTVRRGAFNRVTSIAKIANAQHVIHESGPGQRVFGLATVQVWVPKAKLSAVDMGTVDAERWFRHLSTTLLTLR